MSQIKLNKQNQYNLNVSFNRDEIGFIKEWSEYTKENYIPRISGIKRLMKRELEEKRLLMR
mgnify:FL=1|tara:strand:+ start:886 stop:1068 length:183 start_codon:yes stop_codon:yes gene_type:complete